MATACPASDVFVVVNAKPMHTPKRAAQAQALDDEAWELIAAPARVCHSSATELALAATTASAAWYCDAMLASVADSSAPIAPATHFADPRSPSTSAARHDPPAPASPAPPIPQPTAGIATAAATAGGTSAASTDDTDDNGLSPVLTPSNTMAMATASLCDAKQPQSGGAGPPGNGARSLALRVPHARTTLSPLQPCNPLRGMYSGGAAHGGGAGPSAPPSPPSPLPQPEHADADSHGHGHGHGSGPAGAGGSAASSPLTGVAPDVRCHHCGALSLASEVHAVAESYNLCELCFADVTCAMCERHSKSTRNLNGLFYCVDCAASAVANRPTA